MAVRSPRTHSMAVRMLAQPSAVVHMRRRHEDTDDNADHSRSVDLSKNKRTRTDVEDACNTDFDT
eukprot:scaffold66363_cov28-Tisochrysis_lutea.AAC.2